MAAGKYDFAIEQGTSFRLSFIYKDSDGNVINLTNWCARLIWKTNTNAMQTFTSTNIDYSVYKFTIEPVLGKVTLLFPAETTNDFAFTNAKYDLELQSPDNLYVGGGKYTVRILYGIVTITKRYSQSSTALGCQV